MSISKKVDNFLDDVEYSFPEEQMLYPTDLKDAIIGTVEIFAGSEGYVTRILMDRERCLKIMCERDGMTLEEAIEHFDFNVIGSYTDGVPAYATLIDGIYSGTDD